MAEETELVTEADTEEAAEEAAEEETEAETEEVLVRPEYTALDYVTLGEYKGLNVSLDEMKVTDEDVEEEIAYNLRLAEIYDSLEEGTVQEGDVANIDYEGKLDGEAFDGGTSKGYDLEIGSGTFISGFEDGLIGVAVGDTVDLNLTFPENYSNEELAGQDVVFTVTVNEIKRTPDLTDEHAETLSDGEYTDADSYRASVREDLEADMESQKDSTVKSELLRQISENSEISDYPQDLVDYGVASMKSYYTQMAEMYSMEFEDFMSTYFGMDEETFMEEAAEVVKESLEQELLLKAIAETEGIEVSAEDYQAGCERYMESYGYESQEEFEAAYGEEVIRISILQEDVLEFLVENAIVEETAETETAEETELGEEAETEAETEAPETEAVTEAE
jgi:trigger factor